MLTNPIEDTAQEGTTPYPPTVTTAPASEGWLAPWRYLLPIMLFVSILGQFYWSAYPGIHPYVTICMLVTAVCIWYVHVRVLLSTRRVINASANQSSGGLLSIERTKGALYIVLMFSPALFTFGIVMLLLLPGSVSIYSVILAYSVTALFGSLLFVTFRLLKAERLSRLLANREAWLLMLFVVIMACVSIFTATFFIVSAILPII